MDDVSLFVTPPTYYFFYNGFRVAIYTGIEYMISKSEADSKASADMIKKMKAKWKPFDFRRNEYIPEYLITIDEVNSQKFSAKKWVNLGLRKK